MAKKNYGPSFLGQDFRKVGIGEPEPTKGPRRGMIVYVYRALALGDCTNKGVSSKYNQFVIVGEGVPEIFAPTEDMPAILLKKNGNFGWKAVPMDSEGKWTMFGGNFLHSGDSRMTKFGEVIPCHDRIE